MSSALCEKLKDPSRPVFLFGSTPPREGTSLEKARETCLKFAARSAVLATDGFIVYDIQDEDGRTTMERPFPFRKTIDPAWYASLFPSITGKDCIVYKCAVEENGSNFSKWLNYAIEEYNHSAFNFVGAPTSSREFKGIKLVEACQHASQDSRCAFGCVCIPERHIKKGTEASNMVAKASWGAEWFITQGIYNAEPTIRLLNEYGALCRDEGVTPKKVVLSFAPCGRAKTMTFIHWLGMSVPPETEARILEATNPVEESIRISCENLTNILASTSGCGVPLGINVESLSIYKDEIDGAHKLFQQLQAMLLNSRGSPWSVCWFDVKSLPVVIPRTGSGADISSLAGGGAHQALPAPPTTEQQEEKEKSTAEPNVGVEI